MSNSRTHDHADDHSHASHEPLVIEDEAGNIEAQIVINALQNLLVQKNLLAPEEVTREIQQIEAPGVHLGAKIVARAWMDAAFKARLLANGKSAAAELGIKVGEAQLIVVENTSSLHNLVCCTLCSCYPRTILGQPPAWYISKAYRARAVREPRAVLSEFGLTLGDDVELRVHDSNADMRYLVLPERPTGTEAMSVDELAALVTRDCMVGVAKPSTVPARPSGG
jgi:antitoxin component of MazEF toxin-antitoxin module